MRITFTPQQYRDLVRLISIGAWIEESVRATRGESSLHVSSLEHLVYHASEHTDSAVHVVEDEGELVPHPSLESEVDALLDEYDEVTFAHTLAHRLAERDFFENASAFERVEAEQTGDLPDRAHDFCGAYHREIAEHGVSRLRVLTMATVDSSENEGQADST